MYIINEITYKTNQYRYNTYSNHYITLYYSLENTVSFINTKFHSNRKNTKHITNVLLQKVCISTIFFKKTINIIMIKTFEIYNITLWYVILDVVHTYTMVILQYWFIYDFLESCVKIHHHQCTSMMELVTYNLVECYM